ncbi:hypothetical protein KIPB_003768 [Kipferlia bialata]|uniref:Uncharacterized protein n=1 Tax=Kipferlia bialata TaxID=797122 RepID=A0A9K3GGY1_9EUKA|nr:hypothetical protein KIPB_003768 [Kipferlia bialata]|eukprot:g3768.t1
MPTLSAYGVHIIRPYDLPAQWLSQTYIRVSTRDSTCRTELMGCPLVLLSPLHNIVLLKYIDAALRVRIKL